MMPHGYGYAYHQARKIVRQAQIACTSTIAVAVLALRVLARK